MSDISHASSETIYGVIDPKLERSSSRKITIGHHSFARLDRGNLRAKMKNRDGKFLVKPLKIEFEAENHDTVAYDPNKLQRSYDPLNERLALVKRVTSFKSPTISSDMKINNRIPIQKSLRGETAKRTTVVEIYQNARDRKARHFKIVTRDSSKKPTQMIEKQEDAAQLLYVDDAHAERLGSLGRSPVPLHVSIDMKASYQPNLPRSPQTPDELVYPGFGCNNANGKSPNNVHAFESEHDMAVVEGRLSRMNSFHSRNSQDTGRRSGSRVAFARSDSQASFIPSPHIPLSESQCGTPDLGESFSKSMNGGGFGKKLSMGQNLYGRGRSFSGNSEANIPIPETDGIDGRGTRMSLASVVAVTQAVQKFKNQAPSPKTVERKGSTLLPRKDSTLSFDTPNKVATKTDTVRIVKQQLQRDRELDERMAVWRRRMVLKSKGPAVKLGTRKATGRLRMR